MTKKDELIGRRVICPDDVKGTIFATDLCGCVYVNRDDSSEPGVYKLEAVKLIEPRTHTFTANGDTRIGQLIAEYLSLAEAADRFEKLKKEIKAALPDATAELGVAWEDGDAVELITTSGRVRAYPMSQMRVDVERMKVEYPAGYRYFLKRTDTIALRVLT